MTIKLWHSKSMDLWRWSLMGEDLNQYSGQQRDLREAMNDIANTVEYIMSKVA